VVASPAAGELKDLAAAAAAGAGLVVEDVTVSPAGRRRVLRVIVDLPEDVSGGVPMDAISQAARALSAALDGSDVMGGAPYVLEVSSPGVDRPLMERRHYARARGRLVRLVLRDGTTVSGRLGEVGDADVVLDDGGRSVALADIARGKVEVEFNPPGADLPDDDEPDDDEPDDDEPDDDEPDGDEPDGDEPDGDEPDDEPDGPADGGQEA